MSSLNKMLFISFHSKTNTQLITVPSALITGGLSHNKNINVVEKRIIQMDKGFAFLISILFTDQVQ